MIYHFMVYDANGEFVMSYAVFADCSETWDKNDRLFYYSVEDTYPDTLAPLEDEDRFYIRKYYWKDGQDSAANEYISTVIM